jgi:hypothetical protein
MPSFGRKQKYNESWLSSPTLLATGVQPTGVAGSENWGTGPTLSELITGSIHVTSLDNAATGYLHLYAVITGASAARLAVWAKIQGTDSWARMTTLEVTNVGQHFQIYPALPTEYRFGVMELPAGTLSILYQYTE